MEAGPHGDFYNTATPEMRPVSRLPVAGLTSHCICCDSSNLAKSPAVLMPFVAKRVFGHDPVEISPDWGLRDLRPGMAYTLCHSLQCQDCGVLFLDYRFTDSQMASLYDGYRGVRYTQQREHYEPGYASVAAHYRGREDYLDDVELWLSAYLPDSPAVLDWGGGNAQNSLFLENNRLLHIYDISSVDVVEGAIRIDLDHLIPGYYDLVACSQVLEHVPNPWALVMQMRAVLGTQSLLYLEVPHESIMREYPASLDLACYKHHWHEHINFFSPESMRRLIDDAGLMLVAEHFLPVDIGWRKSEVMGFLARLPG